MIRRAFTLMELLVVLAVLAVVVAIVVPALRRAKIAGMKTACLSNIRSFGMSYRAYANEWQDQAVLGYQSQCKQISYFVHNNDASSGGWKSYPGQLAPMYKTGFLPDARALFCPSETSSMFMFNYRSKPAVVTDNPWPPVIALSNPTRQNTRAGYSARPYKDVLWPEPPSVGITEEMTWPSTKMPRLMQMERLAIFADIVYNPSFVNNRHQDGMNVIYGDGSGTWVKRGVFEGMLKQIPVSASASSGYNSLILNDSNTNPALWTGVWADLDRVR